MLLRKQPTKPEPDYGTLGQMVRNLYGEDGFKRMTEPKKKSFLERLGYGIGVTVAIVASAAVILAIVAGMYLLWKVAFRP